MYRVSAEAANFNDSTEQAKTAKVALHFFYPQITQNLWIVIIEQ